MRFVSVVTRTRSPFSMTWRQRSMVSSIWPLSGRMVIFGSSRPVGRMICSATRAEPGGVAVELGGELEGLVLAGDAGSLDLLGEVFVGVRDVGLVADDAVADLEGSGVALT